MANGYRLRSAAPCGDSRHRFLSLADAQTIRKFFKHAELLNPMKEMTRTAVEIALLAALFGGGCATTQEVEVPGPPSVFAARSVPLIERKIAGQVFWTTQGKETVRASGVQILVYDAGQLASARATILEYERTQYDAMSQTSPGLPSTMMRARLRIQGGLSSELRLRR